MDTYTTHALHAVHHRLEVSYSIGIIPNQEFPEMRRHAPPGMKAVHRIQFHEIAPQLFQELPELKMDWERSLDRLL